MERPLSAVKKASLEERDPEDMAWRVRQAIQKENTPVHSPDVFNRNTVCLTVILQSLCTLFQFLLVYNPMLFPY